MKNDREIKTILAIDTSCDDTSVAVTYENKIVSNVISSQVEMHRKWGGTVPGLAKREHAERIDQVIQEAIKQAIKNVKRAKKSEIKTNLKFDQIKENTEKELLRKAFEQIDAVAVTNGPGLSVALGVGVAKAKELALSFQKPLITVDHMEGHLLSSFAESYLSKKSNAEIKLPALGILVSGGHTELIKMNEIGDYEIIGETLDDAIGEAFDKTARILGLGYPGGPTVEEFAKKGNPNRFDLPIAMKNSKGLNVSYSGIKTAVLYLARDLRGEDRVQEKPKKESWEPGKAEPKRVEDTKEDKLDKQTIFDICASFQNAAILTLTNKIKKAVKVYEFKSVLIGGGVTNNTILRREIYKTIAAYNKKARERITVHYPYTESLFQDNAAMIGVAAYLSNTALDQNIYSRNTDISNIDRQPGKRIDETS